MTFERQALTNYEMTQTAESYFAVSNVDHSASILQQPLVLSFLSLFGIQYVCCKVCSRLLIVLQFVEEQAIDRVHRLTQKVDVIVYKITIKDSVEERILDLQEKKRELANQTIEGGKGGAGKLGMKEILQLFRRDAEHAAPLPSAAQYNLTQKPRILKDISSISREPSREGSASLERKSTTPPATARSASAKEDAVFGRRW